MDSIHDVIKLKTLKLHTLYTGGQYNGVVLKTAYDVIFQWDIVISPNLQIEMLFQWMPSETYERPDVIRNVLKTKYVE